MQTQRTKVQIPKCWRTLVQMEFPEDLAGILSEKVDHTGNADPKPHYDDVRRIVGRFPNNEPFSVELCSGQSNYWGGFTVGEYDSEPMESFGDTLEATIGDVCYVLDVEWI